MPNIKNVDNINNEVVIGNNRIKYYDEILKISNISRTWIFRFQNIEKRKFEEEKRDYANAKARYEEVETRKKNESIRNILIPAAFLLFISIICFLSRSVVAGFLFLFITGGLVFVAYQVYTREINYPILPPTERSFPDKFGLGIEMNSGHVITFAAIGNDGIQALRQLQNDIEDADVHKNIIHFNMNDYNITVENNDGIISAGDYAQNIFHREEQGNL